jgi:viroplasmin and RNaseH domain-containing protein
MGKKTKNKKASAYVVFRGHVPGVYLKYESVQKQIDGFHDNKHEGFDSLSDARSAYREYSGPEASIEPLDLDSTAIPLF